MPKKFTQLMIDKLAPPSGRAVVSDSVLEGLQLRYWQSKKDRSQVDGTFSVRYWSPVTGKQTRHTIGSIHKYKLSEAREIAKDLFKLIDQGQDPQLDKQRKRETDDEGEVPGTIGALIPEFDKRYLKRKRTDPEKVRRTLERELIHSKPSWQNWPISEVTKGDIHKKLDQLVEQGKGYAANRLLEAVRLLFKWAKQRGYIDASPADGIDKPHKERARRRVLDDGEIRALWPAFETLGYPFAPFFQLLLLTGQRSGEVAAMQWSEIDLDARLWSIPAEKTKSDRAHEVPLSPWAADILRGCPQFTSDHVFVGRESTGNHISGFSRAGERARAAAGIDDWRPHDLRRTLRTNLGRLGTPPHVAELVLNHTVKGLQGVYDQYTYTREKREALDAWAAHLRGIVGGAQGKVIALKKT